jgi:NO-binding membrane sensor protein with MHYT domain
MARPMLAFDLIWPKYGMAWTFAGLACALSRSMLAQLACLQSNRIQLQETHQATVGFSIISMNVFNFHPIVKLANITISRLMCFDHEE